MNFEANDLLGHVDEWKFGLHEKLRALSASERARFWKRSRAKARAAGLPLATPARSAGRRPARRRRATG